MTLTLKISLKGLLLTQRFLIFLIWFLIFDRHFSKLRGPRAYILAPLKHRNQGAQAPPPRFRRLCIFTHSMVQTTSWLRRWRHHRGNCSIISLIDFVRSKPVRKCLADGRCGHFGSNSVFTFDSFWVKSRSAGKQNQRENFDPSRPAFEGHSRSSEPTRIDPQLIS